MKKSLNIKFILKITCIFLVFSSSCQKSKDPAKGVLHIASQTAGTYELYSIAGDSTLQYVSEHMGHFNQDLLVSPGHYLILADCSHKKIRVHANERHEATAHVVEFIPPHTPKDGDLFSIQCGRYESSHLKQHINNRYVFHMISGTKDLLVGMLPLKIDFPQSSVPQKLSYELSALKISAEAGKKNTQSLYFVSPSNDLLSITQPQNFDSWQFLLPEDYMVHINGTEQLVHLKPKESRNISPAGLLISTHPDVKLDLYTKIRGNPFNVELNDHHSLELNTHYPVLPGVAKLRFDGAKRQHKIELKAHHTTELKLKSVLVDLGCSPSEWECLGKREVNLYLPKQQYSFLDSVSDVPILYLEDQIQIGIEGSKGIRFQLPKHEDNMKLTVGKVKIRPKVYVKNGYLTDLLRLEPKEHNFFGHSLDISPDKETMMTLITGNYYLTRYTSFGPEMERQSFKQALRVRAGEQALIEMPFFVSEYKFNQIEKDRQSKPTSGKSSKVSPRKKYLEAW